MRARADPNSAVVSRRGEQQSTVRDSGGCFGGPVSHISDEGARWRNLPRFKKLPSASPVWHRSPPSSDGITVGTAVVAIVTNIRLIRRYVARRSVHVSLAIPQYGLYTPVRVCDECFNPPKQSASTTSTSATIENTEKKFRNLDLERDGHLLSKEEEPTQTSSGEYFNCTCGMPLCICEAPSAPEVVAPVISTPQPNVSQKPKKLPSVSSPSPFKPSAVASSGNNMPSLFFSSGQPMHGRSHPLSKSYDLNGEGVDANYFDRQGMSLLHLAAMFNFTEITFMLMDAGANVNAKNAQGETPIDCAQPTLGHKMRRRVDSSPSK
ncbi:hypothetical protein AXG93_369s1020 [Marchantia polymorpha subsp. ruderalis]|uniref:Uncharacterized protein n=1 Tax=Marchantia polymorpha subsp. ruderalis TaxID=1480154 RepID=A0A176VSK8_MARPO|nr:hypothetical protein AXG93_369s1020 [Marchantia polymorpha subsp. ruderalis]